MALPDLTADVVVIGAGHNSLVAAAYLARAGLEVARRSRRNATVGGNTRTEELTLPGFAHDSCSSAHVLIQNNPMIRDDELGLLADHGLDYLATDPAVVLPQQDGELLVMHRDLQATADRARPLVDRRRPGLRRADRRVARRARGRARPLELAPAAARRRTARRRYLELRARSAWDVVHERFAHPVVRSFMLWLAMATIQDPRRPGHRLPAIVAGGRPARLRLDHPGRREPGAARRAGPRSREARRPGRLLGAPVTGDRHRRRRGPASGSPAADVIRVGRAVVAGGHLAKLAGDVEGGPPTPTCSRPATPGAPASACWRCTPRCAATWPSAPAGLASAAAGLRHRRRHRPPPRPVRGRRVRRRRPVAARRQPDRGGPDPRPAEGGGTFKILTIAPYELPGGRSWADEKDEYGAADRRAGPAQRRPAWPRRTSSRSAPSRRSTSRPTTRRTSAAPATAASS